MVRSREFKDPVAVSKQEAIGHSLPLSLDAQKVHAPRPLAGHDGAARCHCERSDLALASVDCEHASGG
jgi:hypothetical protein